MPGGDESIRPESAARCRICVSFIPASANEVSPAGYFWIWGDQIYQKWLFHVSVSAVYMCVRECRVYFGQLLRRHFEPINKSAHAIALVFLDARQTSRWIKTVTCVWHKILLKGGNPTHISILYVVGNWFGVSKSTLLRIIVSKIVNHVSVVCLF